MSDNTVVTTDIHVVAFLKLQGIDYKMEMDDADLVSFRFDDPQVQPLIGKFYAGHGVPVNNYADMLKTVRKEMYNFKMKGR